MALFGVYQKVGAMLDISNLWECPFEPVSSKVWNEIDKCRPNALQHFLTLFSILRLGDWFGYPMVVHNAQKGEDVLRRRRFSIYNRPQLTIRPFCNDKTVSIDFTQSRRLNRTSLRQSVRKGIIRRNVNLLLWFFDWEMCVGCQMRD